MTTMTKNCHLNRRLNQEQLNLLSSDLVDRAEEIFEIFHVKYHKDKKKYYGCCPIHDGDKENAWNLYYAGDTYNGNWKCRTHQCEKIFKPSIIGFIRGLLSKQNGWSKDDGRDKIASFGDTMRFILKFTNKDFSNIQVNLEDIEKRRFISQSNIINKTVDPSVSNITRNIIRSTLDIPAEYYLQLGYSKEILDSYDVGLCKKQNKEMSNRIVVPIYNNNYKYMIGCTGRTIHPYCQSCKCYHELHKHVPPSYRGLPSYAKWRHNSGFKAEDYLYNYWKAKDVISKSKVAILVEGVADCWRLEQAGIHNSVAIFGTEFNDSQRSLIDMTGAMCLVILTDNDIPGKISAAKINDQCCRTYKLVFPAISKKDVGEMDTNLINTEIKPIINNLITEFS